MERTIGELTSRIASGDTEALSILYDAWFDRMYAETRRTTGRDESFCLDVVQDAMMRVIKSLRRIETEAGLWGWLRVTLRSCVCDRLRQESRRQRREAGRPVSTTTTADLTEHEAWLRNELRRLDTPTWTLLMMRHRFGWPLARIAAALGLTPGAVDGRLRRAQDALRRRAREDLNA